jgi:hypothetical protein
MDCKTARLLLDYARPSSTELDATEAQALEEHLTGCESCDQAAGAERRADAAIGKAMRQVDVPDQLRARILARMKEERGDLRRRWIIHGLRAAIAAAAVLLLALGLWRWFAVRPAFPVEQLVAHANYSVYSPHTAAQVEADLKSQGVEITVPADLNYSYLRWAFLTNVEGRRTPLLIFNNSGTNGGQPQHALVFLVADNQFDLGGNLPVPQLTNAYEYHCHTAVQETGGKRVGYVIYYTGDDWHWLQNNSLPPTDAANGN